MKDKIIHYALLPKVLSEKNGDRPILWFKAVKDSEWKPLSSSGFYSKVTRLAHALKSRGMGENSRAAVYSQNCPAQGHDGAGLCHIVARAAQVHSR